MIQCAGIARKMGASAPDCPFAASSRRTSAQPPSSTFHRIGHRASRRWREEAMKRILLAAFLGTWGTQVHADVIYQQPPDPNGGFYRSSWWDPDGSNYDEYVWD